MRPTLLTFFLLLFQFYAFNQDSWTLEQCIEEALNNNVDLAIQDINLDFAELNVKQKKHDFGPNINANFSNFQNFGRTLDISTNSFANTSILINSYSFTGNYDLFRGMQRLNALSKSKSEIEAGLLTKKIAEEGIQLQILTTYLSVIMAKEQLVQAQQQKVKTNQEIDRTKGLISDGILAPNNIILLDAQLANDNLLIKTLENNIRLALTDLKLIMRLDITSDLEIDIPEIPDITQVAESLETAEAIYSTALDNRTEIKSAKLNEKLGEFDLKIAKGNYYPTVSLVGSGSTNFSNQEFENPFTGEIITPNKYFRQFADNLSYRIGLTVNIPIFNKNLTRLGIQQSKITNNRNELLTEKAKLDLYRNVVVAHNNAVAALENYNAAVINESTAKKSLDNATDKLEDGLGTNVEFNVASNNYTIAASRLIEAKYSFIFNVKYLDFYRGIPIKL